MNEDTLVKTMPLPNGRDWEWFADANLVVLGSHLCREGRERALTELQAQWRREGLRLIPGNGRPDLTATQPLATLSAVGG